MDATRFDAESPGEVDGEGNSSDQTRCLANCGGGDCEDGEAFSGPAAVVAGSSGESQPKGWWARECGGKQVLQMALPLMLSMFSYSFMQFCDRTFLAGDSDVGLAAVLPSGVIAWLLLSFPFGVALYTNVFVAQYFGANEYRQVGVAVWHALVLAGLSLPIFIAGMVFAELPFVWSGHPESLITLEGEYLRYMSIGSFGMVVGGVLASYFTGLGRTWTVMVVDTLSALLNIGLDWLLIFGIAWGWLEIPAMGIKGAAIATSLAIWIKCGAYLLLMLGAADSRQFSLFRDFRIQLGLLWRMLRFGSSNGLQFLIECLGITAFSLMVGRLGETEAAATTVAFSINMLVLVPVFGLSTAVSTLVGQQIGRKRPELASRATWTALQIGLMYTSFFGASYLLVPDWYLLGHHAISDNFEQVSELTRLLLVFVAVYCLFDTFQIVMVAAIKGAGDVLFVIIGTLVCAMIFVAAGWTLDRFVEDSRLGLMAWWAALTGWIMLMGVAFGGRFLQGKWKTKSVIEAPV